MEEQPLDLRQALATLGRHRRLIAALAVVGLLAGVGASFALPAPHTATALILLPSSPLDPSGQPTRDPDTEIEIAQSPVVLDAAGRHVHPRLGYSDALSHTSVISTTDDILQVTAKQPTGRRAEELANGVATSFVNYTAKQAQSLSGLTLVLQEEATQLQRQLTDLQGEIGSTSAEEASAGSGTTAGQRDAALLATLQEEQQNASLQYDSVESQVAQAKLNQSSLGTGTTVLEPAITAVAPAKIRPGLWGLAGLAVGLVLAVVATLVVARRDRRLWRRDDIAAAVGSPVVGSVELAARHGADDWVALLRDWTPGVEESWAMRALLRRLTRGRGATEVTFVSLAGDAAALTLGPQLAAAAAHLGMPTAFVDGGETGTGAELAGAVAALSDQPEARPQLHLVGADEPRPTGWVECTVGCVVLDPEDPRWPSFQTSSTTWLVVSSGRATARQLSRVALAADERQHPVSAVVVVNPDRSDLTLGRLPSGYRPAALPTARVAGPARGIVR